MPKTYNIKSQNWRTKRQLLELIYFSYDHGVIEVTGWGIYSFYEK